MISEKEAMTIIKNQSSWAQKLARADDVINNNSDQNTLREQIVLMHQSYLELLT
jgi:dephospho-CoA kinase